MKLTALSRAGALALVVISLAGAAAAQPGHAFSGFLHVEFTCTYPEFSSSTQMAVAVGADGSVTIAPGALSYGGSIEPDEGCLYTRTGEWQLAPTGSYFNGPPAHVAVLENIDFLEHITLVCMGQTLVDEQPSGFLDGGLAFDWLEAITEGAVVEASDQGGLIRWTLGLTQNLAVEDCSFSTIRALY